MFYPECLHYILAAALCLSVVVVCLVAWLVRRSMRKKIRPVPQPEKENISNWTTSQSPPSHRLLIDFSDSDSLYTLSPPKPRMFVG
ncbi:hypothetical protein CHS0354_004633 [Potamilus streckersoni]|uniref:Uncharacterized protein n=1 Tax=Potamilus streckersoni TaxID=2493646 RepID=A0AAE0VQK1_9BIVA|nr:hypothetical protein CHS0354_004633 [Potamilus streckersoni]